MTLLQGNETIILSVDELKQLAQEVAMRIIAEKSPSHDPPSSDTKRYVYGLRGISNLFNVSLVTAQKYKNTFLAPAVSQRGRKITVDVEMALQLFKENQAV